ncbi:MAG: DMT family transporter, partial [Gammaproteobacteria bacterium]|nr:DMT family transporter [Gammaproteobacteria bacterium]
LPLARASFEHGADTFTVVLGRYLCIGIVLGIWLVWRGGGGQRTRRDAHEASRSSRCTWLGGIAGLCFATTSFGTVYGSRFMPVSLVVLVFYLYPAMILLATCWLRRRRPGPLLLSPPLCSLAGLWLLLNADMAGATVVGVLCGLAAAISNLILFLLIELRMQRCDPLASTALGSLLAGSVAGALILLRGELALPGTSTGWLLLALTVGLFAIGLIFMFLAVQRIGSVQSSSVLFIEPVIAVALAIPLLGERLGAGQLLGAALVVLAVFMSTLWTARLQAAREALTHS